MEKPTFAFTPEEQALNARLLAALPRGSSIKKRDRIVDYEVVEMAALFREGNPNKLTAEQVLLAYLNRISQFNGTFETYDENGGYNAFVRIDLIEAQEQARLADEWLSNPNDERGPAPPLCGIAMGVKDSIGIQDRKSTNGTAAFSSNIALQDATCVTKLRAQGAVLVGHNTCSAYSGDTTGTFAGNAWDPARAPGGSSQGSGVAPVARLCAASLGEETGGSMIIPAACNGASAIKPSLGLVSVAGLMPTSNGLDVIGPMCRSVRDASLILSLISGIDQLNDPHTLSAPIPPNLLPTTAREGLLPLRGLTIGVPQTDWMNSISVPPADTYDPDYKLAFDRFKGQLRDLGATVVEFPGLDLQIPDNAPFTHSHELGLLPDLEPITPFKAVFWSNGLDCRHWQSVAEFAQDLPAEYRTELLGHYHPATNTSASYITSAMRTEAEERRRREQALLQQALDDYAVDFMLVMPLGAHIGRRFDGSERLPNQRSHYDVPNLQGWPMLTFPIGYGRTGLPAQLPITAAFWGTRFNEAMIIQAAIDFQDRFPEYHNAVPPDPTFGPDTKRPPHIPRVQPVTPETSTDPIIMQRGRS
ncbi:amidase [Pseudomonas sp.]|uniref:amidase n=1 Tax=Pseudomonas sp. TaxID=306 RepID=UPI003FD6DC6E